MSVWCVRSPANKMPTVMAARIEKYCAYLLGCCSIERKKSFKTPPACRERGLKAVNVQLIEYVPCHFRLNRLAKNHFDTSLTSTVSIHIMWKIEKISSSDNQYLLWNYCFPFGKIWPILAELVAKVNSTLSANRLQKLTMRVYCEQTDFFLARIIESAACLETRRG